VVHSGRFQLLSARPCAARCALPCSGGERVGRPIHLYGGSSESADPPFAPSRSPSRFGSAKSLISFMNGPIGVIRPPAPRAARLVQLWSPHQGGPGRASIGQSSLEVHHVEGRWFESRRSRHLQRLTCRHRKRSDFSGRRVPTFDPHPFSRIRLRPRRRASTAL
jgi:hypothetical protein